MKLLLADDDAFLLDLYTVKFTSAGYEVVATKDAEHALTLLREGGVFDGVILDMVMPGMSGLELLQIIKKEKLGGNESKVIMLSNQSEEADETAAQEAGAIGYIIKAESMPSDVVEKVTHLLHSRT